MESWHTFFFCFGTHDQPQREHERRKQGHHLRHQRRLSRPGWYRHRFRFQASDSPWQHRRPNQEVAQGRHQLLTCRQQAEHFFYL